MGEGDQLVSSGLVQMCKYGGGTTKSTLNEDYRIDFEKSTEKKEGAKIVPGGTVSKMVPFLEKETPSSTIFLCGFVKAKVFIIFYESV